ncbi:54S ribosomal protein L23, mitochondrial protein 1 [Phlyctema vagabunda]|uniref:Large ribosomal subunit protein uL23m n=1 Tax=Phlyctema vagabunda TaxID=108571 RepID=A0ABR4PUF9_9HELO
MAGRVLAQKAPRLGRKEIYLPNFTLQLLRTPALPPTFASFIVPLNLNKLDIRDYLWNVYGVPVVSVRSFVQRQKLRQDKVGAKRPAPRKWFRPRSIKKMTVELVQPFAWPDVPESFEEWDKEVFDAAQKDRDQMERQFNPQSRQDPSPERASIAEQAKALLEGREKWKPNVQEDEWVDDGEPVEVDADVDVNKISKP